MVAKPKKAMTHCTTIIGLVAPVARLPLMDLISTSLDHLTMMISSEGHGTPLGLLNPICPTTAILFARATETTLVAIVDALPFPVRGVVAPTLGSLTIMIPPECEGPPLSLLNSICSTTIILLPAAEIVMVTVVDPLLLPMRDMIPPTLGHLTIMIPPEGEGPPLSLLVSIGLTTTILLPAAAEIVVVTLVDPLVGEERGMIDMKKDLMSITMQTHLLPHANHSLPKEGDRKDMNILGAGEIIPR